MLENSEEKKKNDPHVVFQILNLVLDKSFVEKYGLVATDRFLLLALAKHSGKYGIYPAIDTLAEELCVSRRYVRERIEKLKKNKIISITSIPGQSHRYELSILYSDPAATDPMGSVVPLAATAATTQQLQFQNPAATAATIRTNNQYISSEQREREKAPLSLVNNLSNMANEQGRGVKVMDEEKITNPPLSKAETANAYSRHHRGFSGNVPIVTTRDISEDDPNQFYPSEENKILCQNLKLNLEEELQSFRDRHKYKFTQAEFSKWIKNSAKYISKNSKQNQTPKESRAVVPDWGPGHPSYDSLHKK